MTAEQRRPFSFAIVVAFVKRFRVIDAVIAIAVAWGCWRLMRPYLNPSLQYLRGKVAFWGDEGVVVHAADRIRHGEILYRDFFDFQGPLGYLPFTIAFAIGPVTAKVGRGTMILLMAVWCAVTYLTVKEITRKVWAGVLVAVYFPLCVWPTWPYAYQHFIADLWITCAVLFAIYGERNVLRRGWVFAGTFAALGFWTSISEGVPGAASLLACSFVIRYATNARWRLVLQYLGGFGAVTGVLFVYYGAHGALGAMLRAIFVFPFTNYVEKNKTAYAFDAPDYVRNWTARGKAEGRVAELLVEMTKNVPRAAIVVASLVALVAVGCAVRRHFRRSATPAMRRVRVWTVLGPCALAASLGALAVPVVKGSTRSDICHLGFIQQTSLIALTVLWFPISRARLAKLGWRVVWLLQALAGLALAAAIVQVHAFADANAKKAAEVQVFAQRDLDAYIARQMKVKSVTARLRPDEMFVENYGGYTHLLSQRAEAISFPHLANEPYYAGQFPVAAREIVTKRPRALLISGEAFGLFARHEPTLRSMYVGFDYNYFLAEPDRGRLRREVPFKLSGYGPGGHVRRATVTFHAGSGMTPFTAQFSDRTSHVFTYVAGDRVQIIDGGSLYVLDLAPDGKLLQGTFFETLEGENTHYVELELDEGS